MKKNISVYDRVIRLVIGIVALVAAFTDFFEDAFLDQASLVIGIVLVLATVLQFCPVYYFLGINTFQKKKKIKMY